MAIFRVVPCISYYVEAETEEQAIDIAVKQYQQDDQDSMLYDCDFNAEEVTYDCLVDPETIIRAETDTTT